MTKLIVDPVTRIEGHLRIDTEIEGGRVTAAWSRGEMFRGFEAILAGRDPFDAPVITQRICGVCPISHAVASTKAVEGALGIVAAPNGAYLRNLVLGANYLQSHLLHFYQLSALDFLDVEALLGYRGTDPTLQDLRRWVQQELKSNRVLPAAPFLPRLPGDYPKDARWNLAALAHYAGAFEMRREAHQMAALFGGKMPHAATLVPGGVTCGVDPETVENFRSRLRKVTTFIREVYLPDVLRAARLFPAYTRVGAGLGRYLSYGVFDEEGRPWLPGGVLENGRLAAVQIDQIREEVACSRYRQQTLAPAAGETVPDAAKEGAYSWIKAPRYAGKSCEVGPLARLLVAEAAGESRIKAALQELLERGGWHRSQLHSVMGRHAARALEALLVAERMETWLNRLRPGEPSVGSLEGRRTQGAGVGLTEAPRGALGHWLSVADARIARYQCIVPSTWNFSPRGDRGDSGPVEAALTGTPVDAAYRGLDVARVVRSFDPCIACAIH